MNIHSITQSIQGCFTVLKDHILRSLNTEEKKVAAVVLAIFAGISLICFACCRKRVKSASKIQQPTPVKIKAPSDAAFKKPFQLMLEDWKKNVLSTFQEKFQSINELSAIDLQVSFEDPDKNKFDRKYPIYEGFGNPLDCLTRRLDNLIELIQSDNEIAYRTRISKYTIRFSRNGQEMEELSMELTSRSAKS